MGTTRTLDTCELDDGKTSWRLYEELFESGAVYLELTGVGVELEATGQTQTRLVLRLPLEMARRLATANVTSAQWDEIAKDRTVGFDAAILAKRRRNRGNRDA